MTLPLTVGGGGGGAGMEKSYFKTFSAEVEVLVYPCLIGVGIMPECLQIALKPSELSCLLRISCLADVLHVLKFVRCAPVNLYMNFTLSGFGDRNLKTTTRLMVTASG